MFTFRQAEPSDAEAVGTAVARGFEGYREFAPPFWRPPFAAAEIEQARLLLGNPGFWCLLAGHGGELAGHVAFAPAAVGVEPDADPGLAHLRHLFVLPQWWGTGLAPRLHAAALHEAAGRGYSAMRLFTPSGQARARRFYEREGWALAGGVRHLAGGLESVEYRRALP